MREMKDSGVAWIGETPKEWQVRKIKNYYMLETGFTPDSKNEDFYSVNGEGFDWVTIGDLTTSKFIPKSTKKQISKLYFESFNPKFVEKGSLLYSFKLSVGQTAFTDRNIFTNEAIASFKNSECVNLDFLYYSSVLIEENSNYNIYGARILNQDLIKNAPIVFPPLIEQQKIASLLDTKCSQVDALISNTEKQIEKLKAYKQSLITEVVTKGLDPSVPMKDSGVEWIGETAAHYKTVPIKSLFSIKKDIIGREPDTVISITQKGLKKKDVNENSGQMANSYANYQIVNIGDFAMNHMDLLTGGVGIAEFEGVTSPDYRVFTIRNTENVSKYFLYVFETYYRNKIFYAFGQGAANLGRWRLPAFNFNKVEIPLPPIEEQQQIADYLDEKCSQIDQLIAIKQKKIEKLNTYKKSLIYEYVTGKKEA